MVPVSQRSLRVGINTISNKPVLFRYHSDIFPKAIPVFCRCYFYILVPFRYFSCAIFIFWYHSGIIPVPFRYFSGAIPVFFRCYFYILVLFRYYSGTIIPEWHQNNTGIVPEWYRNCTGGVVELCRSCTGIVPELYRSCTGVVPELCRSCIGVVPDLWCSWWALPSPRIHGSLYMQASCSQTRLAGCCKTHSNFCRIHNLYLSALRL